ncbi:MAG: SGNH/GDSL hydrolase family protein [Actinomycetota bacterium]|nr:SGNH/GDSL hydrolase family protein [Actinomycetota bacterium]
MVLGVGTTRLRWPLLATLTAVALVAALVLNVSGRASGNDDAERCARLAELSAERASSDTGRGPRVAVIGDSYAFGSGLDRPARSWPSRLPGRVHVDGFPGSGFSPRASSCPGVSYADRAAAAAKGADLVVVQGGLNDVDRRGRKIRAGFKRLIRELQGYDVVVVGPATAPARAHGVPRIDSLLTRLSGAAGVRYLRMSHLDLPYLDDRLHLTQAGHVAFGQRVAKVVERRVR